MSKFVAIGAVLGALSVGILASPPPAHAAVTSEMSATCWQQVHRTLPGYGSDAGMDRRRELLLDACMQNGGRIP